MRYTENQPEKGNPPEERSYMGEVDKTLADAELLRIMECPVCNEFPVPPIYSCAKGHFTCNTCMKLLDSCSLCKAEFTNVRNFVLESIIESTSFKCRNATSGCPEVVKGCTLVSHESNCVFRALDCSVPECLRKSLTPKEYVEHMEVNHEVIKCDGKLNDDGIASVILKQNKDSDEHYPCYVKITLPDNQEGPAFLIYSKHYKTFMCWWAACLQPSNIHRYKVVFSLGEEEENSALRWTVPLQCVWRKFDDIRDNGHCVVLPDTHIVPFYVDEKNWQLKVDIVSKDHRSCFLKHYFPLVVLFLVGVFAVVFSLFFESGWSGFLPEKSVIQSSEFAERGKVNSPSEEYIGYRGFYYKV